MAYDFFLLGSGDWLAANGGWRWWGAMSGKCIMRTIASLTADLDKLVVAAAGNNTVRYSSWWLYFRVVGVMGGDGAAAV